MVEQNNDPKSPVSVETLLGFLVGKTVGKLDGVFVGGRVGF